MTKPTKKSRVAKLLKMGLVNAQICEVTGFSKDVVKQYIWQVRNSDKHKARTKAHNDKNKDKIVVWNRNYYSKNKELVKQKRADYWHEYYYKKKCRECGVEPIND